MMIFSYFVSLVVLATTASLLLLLTNERPPFDFSLSLHLEFADAAYEGDNGPSRQSFELLTQTNTSDLTNSIEARNLSEPTRNRAACVHQDWCARSALQQHSTVT